MEQTILGIDHVKVMMVPIESDDAPGTAPHDVPVVGDEPRMYISLKELISEAASRRRAASSSTRSLPTDRLTRRSPNDHPISRASSYWLAPSALKVLRPTRR